MVMLPDNIDQELTAIVGNCKLAKKLPIRCAFEFTAPKPGRKVVIFGGVHGDEPCGYHAVRYLIEKISSRSLPIEAGQVILAICNEEALKKGVRYVNYNLNRLFTDNVALYDDCYEVQRAIELKPILQEAEYFLDLHATSSPSSPFLMCEASCIEDARGIGISPIITGWGSISDPSLVGDTENYVLRYGGRGFTMENGQASWDGSTQSAIDAALRFLRYVGVVSGGPNLSDSIRIYELFHVQVLERPGFIYTRKFSTLDILNRGDKIGSDSKKEYLAPDNCVIVMPADPSRCKEGEDLYLLARERL